jgi:tRNA1Val (adenine37-N6)-methyltransferase
MPNPYFSFKKFTIRQDKATLKVTTDACLLGACAFADSPEYILDIGTGTGILAIMLAQRFTEARIEAIEPDREAADQARINVKNSPWSKRIRILNSRAQDYIKYNKQKYDLILCNPPYHESQLASKDPKANLARHSVDLTFPELAFAVDKLVTPEGMFYVIVPPRPFKLLEKELAPYGIQCIDRLSVFNRPDKPVYRMIGGFSRVVEKRKESSLLIMNEEKEYTPDFRELLKDFYLAF